MKLITPRSLFELANSKGKALLGLDVGSKYIGVAYSYDNNKLAGPCRVLDRTRTNKLEDMADDINTMFSIYDAMGIVVGDPYVGRKVMYNPVEKFIQELSAKGKFDHVPYTYWDECFTSKIYAKLLQPLNLSPDVAKTVSDQVAAVAILQGYMDCMNKSK